MTVRRVQGGDGTYSQQRIKINEDGTISISNHNSNISVSIDNGEHSQYFLSKRPGGEIVEFDIPKWMDDFIKETEIPQHGYRTNPLNQGGSAPKLVDPNMPGISYELPAPWIEWLEEYAQGARIVAP